MRDTIRSGLLRVALVLLCLAAVGLCRAADIEAVTRPSKDLTLSSVLPGRIEKVLAREGDAVRAGQLLVVFDDSVERVRAKRLRALAEDDTRIEAAQAELAQKKEDYEKLAALGKDGAATKWDVEHARLDVEMARLSLQLARLKQKEQEHQHQEAKLQLDRMRLVSPVDAQVEEVFLHGGESADKAQEVIRLVGVDPLWIDVPVPLTVAARLELGHPASVRFGQNGGPTAKGKITFISAMGDAASDTLTIRVELPNPEGRPAGERVQVRFPPVSKQDP